MGPKSVLDHPDRAFLGRITRQSTIGRSSRIYYRNGEGVPFKWEEEPGKAIEPQPNGTLPPLSPPPAFLSSALPKPNIPIVEDDVKEAPLRRMWKHIKKMVKKGNKDISEAIEEAFKRDKTNSTVTAEEKVNVVESEESCYLWKFDGEQMRLTPRSSVSETPPQSLSSSSNSFSSASSSLTSKGLPMEDAKCYRSDFTCGPRNFGQFMLCLIKRSS